MTVRIFHIASLCSIGPVAGRTESLRSPYRRFWKPPGLSFVPSRSGFPVGPVVAHRPDPPGEGGVHGLPGHATGRRAEAGGEEAPELPGRRGRAAGGRAGGIRGRRRRPDAGVGEEDRERRGGGRRRDGGGGWKAVEVEPEAVEVNGNGHAANGIGPSVELALGGNGHAEAVVNGDGKGHAAFPVNGNGHHDEAPEPQQLLFSWAEFMAEEPVKPKGRSRKPQPSSPSLFDWALELEQEREEEPVGAGR